MNTEITSPPSPSSLTLSHTAEPIFDLLGFIRAILRHKWLILMVSVIVPLAVTFYAMRLPKIYEAVATLEYNPTPTRPLGQEIKDVADPVGTYWMSREWYATQNEVIASRTIAEIVVRKLGLHQNRDFLRVPEHQKFNGVSVEKAAQILQKRLDVNQREETRIVEITFEDTDPARATLVTNTILDTYIEKLKEERLGSSVSALEWLSEQLDKLKKELEDSELALHKFKKDNNVLSLSLESRQNVIAADIQRYNDALTAARLNRIELTATLDELYATNREDPMRVHNRWVLSNESVTNLRKSLEDKERERQQLATQYGEQHPKLKSVNETIAALKQQMRHEIDGLIESVETDLRTVRTRETELRKALGEANRAGMKLNLREIEYRKLSREQENNAKLYGILLSRTTQTDLTRLLTISHVNILERALVPTEPVRPRIIFYLVASIFVGLALGIGLAILIIQMDSTLRTAEEVEALGLTVLGFLPIIGRGSKKDLKKSRRRSKKGKHKERSPVSSDRDLIVYTQPKSSVAECSRTIRTNLQFMSTSQTHHSYVVTSPNPLEGKTTVAISIAISMAQSGKKVLLVDTDLRRPRIHKAFELSGSVGITSVLVEEYSLDEAVQSTQVEGLDLLPSGPVPPNPSELLQTSQFSQFLEEISQRYDRIVFDSPPLGAVTDAAVLAPQVSGAILVVQSDSTSRDAVRTVTKQLHSVGANLLGAIINSVDLSNGRYGYGYGGYYYYYRGYGHYYGDNEEGRTVKTDQQPSV